MDGISDKVLMTRILKRKGRLHVHVTKTVTFKMAEVILFIEYPAGMDTVPDRLLAVAILPL